MPETWRLLPYDDGGSAEHLALSDALVRAGVQPSIWWHSTSTPTLILGAGQQQPAVTPGNVLHVSRQAGGTAVLAHDGVVGLDVFLPKGHRLVDSDILESYRWLGEVWIDALAALGISAHLVTVVEARTASPPPEAIASAVRAACFGALSPYEAVVDGRKLIGLAQVRRSNGVLLQAGFHRRYDAETLAELLAPTDRQSVAAELRRRAAGLDEVTARPPATAEVIDAFTAALLARQDVRLQLDAWTEAELTHAQDAVTADRTAGGRGGS